MLCWTFNKDFHTALGYFSHKAYIPLASFFDMFSNLEYKFNVYEWMFIGQVISFYRLFYQKLSIRNYFTNELNKDIRDSLMITYFSYIK